MSADSINEKIVTLHPPQKLLTTEEQIMRKFDKLHPLHFVYVGKSFYRKGGAALLQALVKLRKDFDFKLTLIGNIGSMEWREDVRIDRKDEMLRLIEANKDWIDYHEKMPNDLVLQLMRTADVGFLPTRGDTYGYSVLEMQACGLPCVTTNLRALPEINNDKIGWMIPIACDEFGTEIADEFEQLQVVDETIKTGLEKTCADILTHPDQLQMKSLESFRAVSVRNNPEMFAKKTKEIYEEALG